MTREFEEIMKEVKLPDLLNKKGKFVVMHLSALALKFKEELHFNETSMEVVKILDQCPWIESIMATVFCLDMLLQASPMSDSFEDYEMENMFKYVEEIIKKGRPKSETE